MFTKLTTASVSFAKGQKIKGATSGATGIVAEACFKWNNSIST